MLLTANCRQLAANGVAALAFVNTFLATAAAVLMLMFTFAQSVLLSSLQHAMCMSFSLLCKVS